MLYAPSYSSCSLSCYTATIIMIEPHQTLFIKLKSNFIFFVAVCPMLHDKLRYCDAVSRNCKITKIENFKYYIRIKHFPK